MEDECKPQEQVLPPEVQDVEEGEISDSGSASSVEEITEEDFKKQGHQPSAVVSAASADFPPKAIIVNLENNNSTNNYPSNTNNLNLKYKNDFDNNNTNSINQQQTRVWTMRNVYDYYSRGGGHNLALASWASAVKSKPSDLSKPSDEIVAIEVPKAMEDTVNLKGDGSPENSGSVTVGDSLKVDGSPENSVSSNIDARLKRDDTLLEISGSVTGGVLLREGSVESSRGENKVANAVIEIDDEIEDGELEEGEIDLDSDVNPVENKFHTLEGKAAELELKSTSILKGLENVDVECAEKSFQEVYSLMEDFLESLHELAEGISLAKKEDLIQLLFNAVKSLQTVFPSMSEVNKEKMDENMKRFAASLMAQKNPVLSTEQLKEMEVLVSSMNPTTVSMNAKAVEMNNEMPIIDGFAKSSVDNYSEYPNMDLINDPYVDAIPMEISDESGADETFESLGVVEVSSKYKGLSLPLLDLHKDHDADDLPSPTRDASYNLPISNVLGIVGGKLKPEWPVPRISLEPEAAAALHPYESDAVKNVSTYQQKFGRSSFLMNDELPSPTPSGDGDTAGGGDITEEISSSIRNVYALSTSLAELPRSSFTTTVNYHNGQVLQSCWSSSAPVSLVQIPQPKPSTTRNRDPRLRFLHSDCATNETLLPKEPEGESAPGLLGSRKQKTAEEPKIGLPALKKPRHESFESGVVHNGPTVTGSSGWQNDGGTFKPLFGNDPRKLMNTGNTTGVGSSGSSITPNVIVNDNLPGAVSNPLNVLLQDFIINPSLLMDFYQMEQKKSAALTKTTIQLPSLISALGSVPLMSSVTPSPSVVMKGSSETSQVVTHTTPAEESGVIRMKPRDPRRILHTNNTLQKAGSLDDQSLGKTSILSLPRRASFLNEQRHEDNVEKKSIPTSSSTGPDITSQFTKNLQNIADLVSVSQSTSSPSAPVSHMPTSQSPAPPFQGRSTSSVSSDVIQTSTGLASREASTVSSQPQPENNWGDVEHLFDGFDDQQKAAIQRERARRMEEQRKMFAARKLCLVLDLDHTLLNSAKFDEVEPKHHEMLRKREEEDRENPQRNLFRFPHMQMWTKLRPGIWNFLERASKLYELHLYTMGNKLYATEMAKLLDPKGELFAGRVISRGDDTDPVDGDERVPRSKDLEGVLGMESSVVIIDDSLRVWPHNKLNLIVVERYIYFPCSRRQFGLPGPSLLEIDHDERLEDGTLASSLSVIERIHSNFFSHQSLLEADVRNILASEQRKILAGCRIVFSRIIPVGDSKPHLHPLWQSAEQFGAVCTNSIDDQVTHVVAYSLGTEKVNWALSHGRFVVRPNWVEASTLLYRRANEHDFAIK